MAPDLNSLPPSSPAGYSRIMNSSSANSDTHLVGSTESPPPGRSQAHSLQAAATMNAGLQHEPGRRSSSGSLSRQRHSPQAGRRRSVVLMNLQLNDPGLPGPGELQEQSAGGISHGAASPQPLSGSPLLVAGDQRRSRAPSLGELHQELEAEQEAQVNRLLQMIRQQQVQLQQLQASQGQNPTSLAAEDMTPISERSSSALPASGSLPPSQPLQTASATSTPRSPVISHPRSSFDANRDLRPSRTSSHQTPSPRLRSTSISGESAEPFLLGGRDESAFYQAETQSLVRENQMLRHRIRELERQLNEAHSASSVTHEPSQSSLLLQSTSASEEDGGEVFRRNPSNDNPKDD